MIENEKMIKRIKSEKIREIRKLIEKDKMIKMRERIKTGKYIYLRTVDGRLKKIRNPSRRTDIEVKNSLLDREIERLANIKRVKNRENFHMLFEKIMKEKGIKVYKNGWPDYVVESKSKLSFVEVKNPKEKLRENQRGLRELFEKYRLRYFVYRGEEEMIKNILDE